MLSTVPRRLVELGSVLLAVVALGFVLLNATLVDRRPPSIGRVSLSAAAGGDRLAQTLTAIDVEFSEAVRTGPVERRFRILPFVPGSFAWEADTTLTFTPAEKLPGDTEFSVTIEPGFEDLAGNVATAGLDGWTFRTIGPPAVVSAEPVLAADGVAVDSAVVLTFDRLMDTRSVERAIEIAPAATYRPSWSGPVLTIGFDRPLAFGTTYTIDVGTEAADTDGSHLRAPYQTTFTTVAAGLTAQTVVPAPNVAGVSVRSPVALVFDGAVDPASIEGALRITPPVGGELRLAELPDDTQPPDLDPSASPGDSLRVLVFTPSEPLASHTTYTVALDPVVRRLGDERQVAAGSTWSFTTGAPTASIHNHVAFLSARSGVRNLWLMNPDGSSPRQLTTEIVPVSGFDVSSDGARIAWSAGGVVRVGKVDGTDIREVTPADAYDYAPAFSPDGRRLLVARRGPGGADGGYWLLPVPGPAGDGAAIQVMATGAPPIGSVGLAGDGLVPAGGSPEWVRLAAFDPTGRFVFIPAGLGVAATLLDLDPTAGGSGPVPLNARGPAVWSVDDRAFVVAGSDDPGRGPGIFVVGTDRSVARAAETAPPGAEPIGAPAVTLDGRLAFPIDPDGDASSRLAIADGRGGAPVLLTTSDEYSDSWPAFSPDGAELLFVRVRPGTPSRSEGIWAMLPDGSDLRRLTTDGAYPRWVP